MYCGGYQQLVTDGFTLFYYFHTFKTFKALDTEHRPCDSADKVGACFVCVCVAECSCVCCCFLTITFAGYSFFLFVFHRRRQLKGIVIVLIVVHVWYLFCGALFCLLLSSNYDIR